MKVRRPWLVGPRTIEYKEEELVMSDSTMLVRHVCTAPSQGTAIHRYRGQEIGIDAYSRKGSGGPFPYPWLQGFAYGVGRVEQVGSAIRGLGIEEGTLVYTMKLTAEYSVLTQDDVIVLPQGVDPLDACMVMQAEVGLKGARAGGIHLGDTVLVTGQGPIGNFAAQLCKLAGAHRVIVTDLSDMRLDISRQVGVDLALNPSREDVLETIEQYTHGIGADIVVESSGSPQAFLQACHAAAGGGRVVVIGWILDSYQFNLSDAFTPKGLEMVVCHSGQTGNWLLERRSLRRIGMRPGSSVQARKGARGLAANDDFVYLLELMAEGKLRAKEMVTHRFPLKDLVPAWREFIDVKQEEYVQVVFES